MAYLDQNTSKKLVPIGRLMGDKFTAAHWNEVGFLTGCDGLVQGHGRLLRSLSFSDDDYPEACLSVLAGIVRHDPANLKIVEDYIAEHFEDGGANVSSKPDKDKWIRFTPSVFEIPSEPTDQKMIAVMMPFHSGFDPVYQSIKSACSETNWFHAIRADNIWDHSVVVQDVFSLIYRSAAVVCDFSGRNPNVFYEAGIAHTLGKTVIPITQSAEDIPSDLRHHRWLHYHSNKEGLSTLRAKLGERIITLDPVNAGYF